MRLRLFESGNTKCPICLAQFTRAGVESGTEVTLEHAPPKSLGGSVICLTCKKCNNKASLVDHHAYLSKKARDDWRAGKGVPIVVGLFGHKKKYRFIPQDSKAPYPAQRHFMRNGSIHLGPLPAIDSLDIDKGISFRIPQRDDYEFVSMVKSAYLMVFSLMGANGYRFAQNIGLTPVREQIMNPDQTILKSGFIVECRPDLLELCKLDMSVVFLCVQANPPFWLVPLGNKRAVILSCGAAEPIDELTLNGDGNGNIPLSSLVGWVSGRFDGSASIAANCPMRSDIQGGSLAGTVGGPFPTSQGGWVYVSSFHQEKEFVALPLCPVSDWPTSKDMHVVQMLSDEQAIGKNLDLGRLARANKGMWKSNLVIKTRPSDEGGK